jgi:hypothetical protein
MRCSDIIVLRRRVRGRAQPTNNDRWRQGIHELAFALPIR